VPLEVVNDGDVTRLPARCRWNTGVLGSLGSSEAGGYVDAAGAITGWLNELAFAPVDYNPGATADEWSGDTGVGALYFSQQSVFRLARGRHRLPPARRRALKHVQGLSRRGRGDLETWGLPGPDRAYADFYDLKHVLILGRVTSGRGGPLILEGAKAVLAAEFPEIAARVNIQLPDEKSRRVGQSIAAASLPALPVRAR
jgi:hypothetical protein